MKFFQLILFHRIKRESFLFLNFVCHTECCLSIKFHRILQKKQTKNKQCLLIIFFTLAFIRVIVIGEINPDKNDQQGERLSGSVG